MLHERVQIGGPAHLECYCVNLHRIVPTLPCVSEKAVTYAWCHRHHVNVRRCKAPYFDETGVGRSPQIKMSKRHMQSFENGA